MNSFDEKNWAISTLRKQGFNIFPLPPKSKKPIQNWKKWQTQKCEEKVSSESNYAVVCGYNNLIVLDLDHQDLYNDFTEFHEKTWIVKSGKGFHIYLKCLGTKLPKIQRLCNTKNLRIDLQSQGTFVVGAGSIHPETNQPYKIICSKNVLQIDPSFVLKKLKDLKFKNSNKKTLDDLRKPSPLGKRNQDLFDYLLEYKKLHPGLNTETLWNIAKERNKKNSIPLDEKELKTIFNSSLNYHSKEKKKTAKTVKKLKGWIGSAFVESILLDDKPAFLVNENGSVKIDSKYEYEEVIFNPLDKDDYGYTPYSFDTKYLPNFLGESLKKDELLDDLKKYIDFYLDIDEIIKHLILIDLFLSYCQEKINITHYPFFVGETESGKSTALYLFQWLAYRCLYSQDLTQANVFEFVGKDEEGTGVICEDEAQDLSRYKEKLRIYKNTYAKGSRIPRILNSDSGNRKQVFYKGFCLKVFAGELIPEDKGFKERLAVAHMSEGFPKGNIKSLNEKEKHLLNVLRNKLLVWKVQNIKTDLQFTDVGLEKRDAELWQDFLNISSNTKYFSQAHNVVKYFVKQRHENIWNSLEARIFKILYPKLENNKISLQIFWNFLTNDQDDFSGTLDKESWIPHDYAQKVTRHYLSKLFTEKFQAKRIETIEKRTSDETKHKVTNYIFDSIILKKLCKKYNYEDILKAKDGQLGQQGKTTLDQVDQDDQDDQDESYGAEND